MVSADEYDEAAERMKRLAELEREKEEEVTQVESDLNIKLTGVSDYVMSDYEAVTTLSKNLNINATDARKRLSTFPSEYVVDGQNIPDLVRKMRKARRKLKGDSRIRMSEAIDTVIDGYADHINKCIDSIYWIKPYKVPLLKMRFNEKDLSKLNKISEVKERRVVVDSLCKLWEIDLKKEGMAFSPEYAKLEKESRLAKKEFREELKKVSDQSLVKSKKERTLDFIMKAICENPGIGLLSIHDKMPNQLHKMNSSNTISKMIKKLEVGHYDGSYYKLPSELKKNVWAYTAAFIDSDGYITMDRNHNPRVGLVATGERGKVFMNEMHKSIGFGKLHLDQKSPQDTRPVNRLNFYSQDDVYNLLTKCLPHFRMKKGNAELLLELIRMKKSYKKADWYKGRCEEIFKLMKWENHKDHVGFDFSKEGIYVDDISKLQGNCKMSLMDELEGIGGIIAKQQVKTFVITEVDWDDAEYIEGESVRLDESDLPTYMAVPIADLGFPDDWAMTQEYIDDAINNFLEDETGYTAKGFMWHYVDENGKVMQPEDFPEYEEE
jgi:hypothetical protein|tara:strand:+ start:1005 stop:2654 length:1650 start_codon:yes stop_codon:yes gene_type:complete